MLANSVVTLFDGLKRSVEVDGDKITVIDETILKSQIDDLVYNGVFGDGLVKETARWLVWELGQALGIYPASIHELYMAVGRGDVPSNFTVPAINVRAMNFNTSRAVFRAAKKLNVGAMLFEIARSEIGYTAQRPAEYVTGVIGAAIKEGYRGPLFIQGDHFQVSASRFGSDPDTEVQAVKDLLEEAVRAGFYNIDIDTSTLVDLSHATLDDQQKLNYTLCADFTVHARQLEPEGITISLGGEIGEVGHKNSTVEELHAFMDGYTRTLDSDVGLSKISVQTGTSHGGVVLPDGTLADVSVDFETLRELSRSAREDYGLGGAVQHGASTLPPSAFGKFPEVGTLEIHLATGFQNLIYDHLPEELTNEAYGYLHEHHKHEWKEGQTEDQFIYKTRKRAIGPFKKAWWDLDNERKEQMAGALQKQFEFLFEKLNVGETREIAAQVTTHVELHKERPFTVAQAKAEEDVSDLAD
jgi:fructose/tagatose bisphosphate aldolase